SSPTGWRWPRWGREMVQNIIVGLIVFAAALYSIWMLMPSDTRRAASAWLAALARGCGLGEQESRRLQANLSSHSSCGECAGCKGCVKPASETPGVAAPQP